MILPKSKITQQSIASHSYYKHVHVPNIFKASERVQANKDHRILRATDRNFVHYLC